MPIPLPNQIATESINNKYGTFEIKLKTNQKSSEKLKPESKYISHITIVSNNQE